MIDGMVHLPGGRLSSLLLLFNLFKNQEELVGHLPFGLFCFTLWSAVRGNLLTRSCEWIRGSRDNSTFCLQRNTPSKASALGHAGVTSAKIIYDDDRMHPPRMVS
jgi:hypothetical protein